MHRFREKPQSRFFSSGIPHLYRFVKQLHPFSQASTASLD